MQKLRNKQMGNSKTKGVRELLDSTSPTPVVGVSNSSPIFQVLWDYGLTLAYLKRAQKRPSGAFKKVG